MRLTYIDPHTDLNGKYRGAYGMLVCLPREEVFVDEMCQRFSLFGFDEGDFFYSVEGTDSNATYFLKVANESEYNELERLYRNALVQLRRKGDLHF